MPPADAARTVIGPDHPAAARIVVVGIVAAVIIAPVEVAIAVMRAIDPVAMKTAIVAKSAVAIAATMKGRCGAEAADMAAPKATAAETADMSSAAVETTATKTATAMEAATMSTTAATVANLGDHVVACSLRRRQRRRIDRSHRFGTLCSPGRQHQRGNGRKPEQAYRACPSIQDPQHGILPESERQHCGAASLASLFNCSRSQD